MVKKKMTIFLSVFVLSNTCSVISCGKTNIERKINPDNNEKDNTKPKNTINNLKDYEVIKEINTQIAKIKLLLDQGIDGSKDFTPSQSLADISVHKKIIEKVKKLCGNPENITFISQLKSKYFKAGNENYVDVEIVYAKKDFQIRSMYHDLQIKNVKQDLEELVNKAVEDLKNPIDFSKSLLIENDDFNLPAIGPRIMIFFTIEREFIKVLNEQLEQDDERLSIRLVNKNQELLNGHKIEVEVIGKDDNEEIIKTIQVTPIKLLTINDYINALVKTIKVNRIDKLFANIPSNYVPSYYDKKNLTIKVMHMFVELNIEQLQRRQIKLFGLNEPNHIRFVKVNNSLNVSIKLEFNKLVNKIELILVDVENHPKYILNEVVNHFGNNGIDLANQPIFQDSDFESDEVKNKILEIMMIEKHQFDEKNDINIKINQYNSFFNEYFITFSHKYPQIIKQYSLQDYKYVNLKNIQTSPKQDLENFMNNRIVKNSINNPITISAQHFSNLHNWDSNQFSNLKEDNAYLNSYLETLVREDGLSFSTLPDQNKLNVQIAPKRIISKSHLYEIVVEYEFKFKKSGVAHSITRDITFKK